MPAVQIRDFPDEMYSRLKAEAASSGRSIAQQTKFILLEHLNKQGDAAASEHQRRVGEDATSNYAATMLSSDFNGVAAGCANPFQPQANKPELDAARQARRKAAFEQIESHPLPPHPKDWDAVRLVREMRDER